VPPLLAVFDELAYFSATVGDHKQQNEFTTLGRDLVAPGRAAGVIVVAAAQRPSADIVPASLREVFGYRWAFRCSTDSSSDVILGHGWPAAATPPPTSTQPPAASLAHRRRRHPAPEPCRLPHRRAGPPARRRRNTAPGGSGGVVNADEDQAVDLLRRMLGAVLIEVPRSAGPPPSNHGSDAEGEENRRAQRQQAGAQPLGRRDPSGHLDGEEHADDQVTQPRHLPHPVSMRGVSG
jgi:hypothetical protein